MYVYMVKLVGHNSVKMCMKTQLNEEALIKSIKLPKMYMNI